MENDVHWLRLGDVEAVSAPGEVAPEMGARMHDTLRARHRLILGLCDDEVGYVLGWACCLVNARRLAEQGERAVDLA